MSANSRGNRVGKARRGHSDRRGAGARISYAGLKIDLPPELDFPAGAPFATRPQAELRLGIPDGIQRVLKPLAVVATNAWRAKNKMTDPGTGEPLEEMRRAYRFVENILTALGDAGVRVLDFTAVKVVSFTRVPGLSRQEVTETIRPSVFWQDQLLQTGEVIVEGPATAQEEGFTLETMAGNGCRRAAHDETDSTDTAAVPDGHGVRTESMTGRSTGAADSHRTARATTPIAGSEAGQAEHALPECKCQLDADLRSVPTADDVPAKDYSVPSTGETATEALEGVDDEQDDD